MKVVAGIFGGLILAIIGAMLVTVTFAASPDPRWQTSCRL